MTGATHPEGGSGEAYPVLACAGCGRKYRGSTAGPPPRCPKCGGALARIDTGAATAPRSPAAKAGPRPPARRTPARIPGRAPGRGKGQTGGKTGKKALIAIAGAVALALGVIGLVLWRRGEDEAALRSKAAAEHGMAARAVLDAMALAWRLEADGVRESEAAWAAWREAGRDPAPAEDALRAWLGEKRPAALRGAAESLIDLLDEPSRSTIDAASRQLGVPRADFVLDWLTFRGHSRFETLEKLWKEPRGFPALDERVAGTTFEGVAVAPSRSPAFAVVSRTDTSLEASLFGSKLRAAAGAGKEPRLPLTSVTIESNDHRLRIPLVPLPDSLEVPVAGKPGGGYLVGWKAEIEEYLRTGNREDWRSRAFGSPSPAAGATASPGGAAAAASAPSDAARRAPEAVIFEKLSPAVPMIETGGGSGSGFLVDSGGRAAVITNLHVVLAAEDELTVRFFKPGSTEILMAATVKAADCRAHDKADLVIIPLEKWKSLAGLGAAGIRPIPLAEKDRALKVGEPVLKIGHPGGGEGTLIGSVGTGMVSGPPRPFGEDGILYIQTTVNINPGDSGGPLLDPDGRVIGVNTMRQVIAGGALSLDINFALDVSYVRDLAGGSGAPLLEKRRELLDEQPIAARRVETEDLLRDQGYSVADAKNTSSLILEPNGRAERKLDLRPGVAYVFWTVGMPKDASRPEQVAVEVSGESSVSVARAPLGGLLYVTPKQAGRHRLLLRNLSDKELHVDVTARRQEKPVASR